MFHTSTNIIIIYLNQWAGQAQLIHWHYSVQNNNNNYYYYYNYKKRRNATKTRFSTIQPSIDVATEFIFLVTVTLTLITDTWVAIQSCV